MSKYIIQINETPEKDIYYVDANGWLQPDMGLAKRYDTSDDAQTEITAHAVYGRTGTIVTVAS